MRHKMEKYSSHCKYCGCHFKWWNLYKCV